MHESELLLLADYYSFSGKYFPQLFLGLFLGLLVIVLSLFWRLDMNMLFMSDSATPELWSNYCYPKFGLVGHTLIWLKIGLSFQDIQFHLKTLISYKFPNPNFEHIFGVGEDGYSHLVLGGMCCWIWKYINTNREYKYQFLTWFIQCRVPTEHTDWPYWFSCIGKHIHTFARGQCELVNMTRYDVDMLYIFSLQIFFTAY